MNHIILRKMSQREYQQYSHFAFDSFVHQAAIASGESLSTVRGRVGYPASEPKENDLWRVIEHMGQDAGYIWIHLIPNTDEAFGYEIYLDEKFRGQGIGRQVLSAGRILLREFGIRRLKGCVFESNTIARELYKSFGFKEVGFREEKKQYELEIKI